MPQSLLPLPKCWFISANWISVGTNLILLGFFKYFNFFIGSAEGLIRAIGIPAEFLHLNIVLPVGISFYTFKTISYTVDIYRGKMKAEQRFVDFALFLAFFPPLLAGPIDRASSLLPQLSNPRQLSFKQSAEGIFLIFISINFLFPYPLDPQVTSVGQLNTYFEYGRSLEGKLSRMVGSTDESSAPIAQAGWLDPELWKKLKIPVSRAPGEELLVAIYGMSFSNEVGEEMKAINPRLGLRMIAGPAAPPNYSFAAYNLDRGKHQADIVILGLLASSVKAMRTLNGMTWQFEGPAPYTYPRYFVEDGKLKAIWPKILSLAQLRASLQDKKQWDAFVTQMREHDQFLTHSYSSGIGWIILYWCA